MNNQYQQPSMPRQSSVPRQQPSNKANQPSNKANQHSKTQPAFNKRQTIRRTIYTTSLLTRNVVLPYTAVSNNNVRQNIHNNLMYNYEGKCVEEGFVKPGSIKLLTYSAGDVYGTMVSFCVTFQCDVCFLVAGTVLECKAISITNAGIHAESAYENPNPITVFVANDHNYMKDYFSRVKENDIIFVRVIGQTFQLNDKTVSVIGTLKKTD